MIRPTKKRIGRAMIRPISSVRKRDGLLTPVAVIVDAEVACAVMIAVGSALIRVMFVIVDVVVPDDVVEIARGVAMTLVDTGAERSEMLK